MVMLTYFNRAFGFCCPSLKLTTKPLSLGQRLLHQYIPATRRIAAVPSQQHIAASPWRLDARCRHTRQHGRHVATSATATPQRLDESATVATVHVRWFTPALAATTAAAASTDDFHRHDAWFPANDRPLTLALQLATARPFASAHASPVLTVLGGRFARRQHGYSGRRWLCQRYADR